MKEILTVFHEEGLGYYIFKAKLRPYLPFAKKVKQPIVVPVRDLRKQAESIRKAFERLGPTFIKLGQLLSLRPDLVPKEYSEEFEKLTDKVPVFPFGRAKKIIEQDLKQPMEKIFKSFDKKVLASASIAQVYKAKLNNGIKVAVKVQRPDVKERIDADLAILFHLTRMLEKHFPDVRKYRPVDVVKEFALWTRKELNFEKEAANAVRLRKAMQSNSKKVKVPKIYSKYSSSRILTMDYVEGIKIDNVAELKKHKISIKNIVMTYFTSILEQALLYGLFHADPHPANIFVTKGGKLVYLDYGIMGELKQSDRNKIIRFIRSIGDKDAEKSINIIISLAKDITGAKLIEFKTEAKAIMEEVYQHSIGETSYANAFYKIISMGARYNVMFDPNHVLMAKSVYQAEGLALKLYPKFKVSEGLQNFAEKHLAREFTSIKLAKKVAGTLLSKKELLVELPEHVARIVEQLEKPEPPQKFDITQLHELEREIEYVQKRRNLGLITFALILASTVLFYMEGRTEFLGLPVSVILFVIALIFLVYFLLFSKRKEVENEKSST